MSNNLNFEERLAYFFNCKDPEKITQYYRKALEKLSEEKDTNKRFNALFDDISECYKEIKHQSELKFDISIVSTLECELIIAHKDRKDSDMICSIYINLYSSIFGKTF
jgi:hypothetical protein